MANSSCSPETHFSSAPLRLSPRLIRIEPEVDRIQPKVKVVLVVDNSDSMEAYQSYLSQGMDRLLKRAIERGYELELQIHTTTSVHAYEPYTIRHYAKRMFEYFWVGGFMKGPLGEWVPASPNERYPEMKRLELQTALPFNGGGNDGSVLRISSSMGSQELELVRQRAIQAIRTVGTGGSDLETGLCSIARALDGLGPHPVFSVGEKAAFVLISDSDDTTRGGCLQYEEYKNSGVKIPYGIQPGDDDKPEGHYYYVDRLSVLFSIDNQNPATSCKGDEPCKQQHYANVSASSVSSCSRDLPEPCSQSMLDYLAASGFEGVIPSSCRYSCAPAYVFGDEAPGFETRNACEGSFQTGGTAYGSVEEFLRSTYSDRDFPSFFPSRCEKGAAYRYQPFYLSQGFPFYGADTTEKLKLGIRERLREKFGETGYFVSAIVNNQDPAALCPQVLVPSREYVSLVETLGSQGSMQSICADDYSPALEGVENFVTRLARNTLNPGLREGESIRSVAILRGGQLVGLESQDYQLLETDQLEIRVPLEPTDSVLIEAIPPPDFAD